MKLFGENNPSIPKKIAKKIFDHVDIKTFMQSARFVSKDWQKIVNKKSTTTQSLLYLLSQCPPFENERTGNIHSVKKLSGGLTNSTFYFERAQDDKLVARHPGKLSNMIIDRKCEAANAEIAAANQSAPGVIYTNCKGIQITTFLENPTPMTAQLLRNPNNLMDVTSALKRLHTCGKKFANDIDVFARNKKMLSVLKERHITLSNEYLRVEQSMDELEMIFTSLPIEKAPCHNDTTPTNFIRTNGRIIPIDLEYSGNNDPVWDLACLSMEARFTKDQDHHMLMHYFKTWNEAAYQRFTLYKPVVEYWTALWYQVQIANNNLQDSFENLKAQEEKRFTQCKNLLKSDEFRNTLNALKENQTEECAICKII